MHSKYAIKWNPVPKEVKEYIGQLMFSNYNFSSVNVDGIRQVDEWERMSNNFRVPVLRDARLEFVLLRKHINLQKESDVVLVGDIIDFLRKQGLSVPKIITATFGNEIFYQDGNFFQLYDFIQGDHYRGTDKELRDVAGNIARLHIAFTHAGGELYDRIAQKSTKLGVSWKREKWENFFYKAHRRDGHFDVMIAEAVPFLLEELDAVDAQLDGLPAVRVQVVRNSIHPHDTLYENECLKAFLDFEETGVSELVRDVANACHRFVRQYLIYNKKNEGHALEDALPYALETFINAYSGVYPLEEKELEVFPAFMRIELLRKLHTDIGVYYINDSTRKLENGELEKKLALLREVPLIARALRNVAGRGSWRRN